MQNKRFPEREILETCGTVDKFRLNVISFPIYVHMYVNKCSSVYWSQPSGNEFKGKFDSIFLSNSRSGSSILSLLSLHFIYNGMPPRIGVVVGEAETRLGTKIIRFQKINIFLVLGPPTFPLLQWKFTSVTFEKRKGWKLWVDRFFCNSFKYACTGKYNYFRIVLYISKNNNLSKIYMHMNILLCYIYFSCLIWRHKYFILQHRYKSCTQFAYIFGSILCAHQKVLIEQFPTPLLLGNGFFQDNNNKGTFKELYFMCIFILHIYIISLYSRSTDTTNMLILLTHLLWLDKCLSDSLQDQNLL